MQGRRPPQCPQHGLTAENAGISLEDEEAFHELRTAFLDHLQPVGPLESSLFEFGVFDHEDDFEEQ